MNTEELLKRVEEYKILLKQKDIQINKLIKENCELKQKLEETKNTEIQTINKTFTLGPFGINYGVPVQLELYDGGYLVTGPREVIKFFEHRDLCLFGSTSPLSSITLDTDSKIKAGIPPNATHFCFSYPLAGFTQLSTKDRQVDTSTVWINFLTVGGFIYSSIENGKIKIEGINAFGEGNGLFFSESYNLPCECIIPLHRDGRLQDVTIVDILEFGYDKFCWISPHEQFPDANFPVPITHGAFAYISSTEKTKNIYFCVTQLSDAPKTIQSKLSLTDNRPFKVYNINGEKRNIKTQDTLITCSICIENTPNLLFDPCGHIVCCLNCGNNENIINCPICRTRIQKKIKAFIM